MFAQISLYLSLFISREYQKLFSLYIMFYFDYLQSAIRGFVCGEAMNVTITGSCI
jgi:hypothetical protein